MGGAAITKAQSRKSDTAGPSKNKQSQFSGSLIVPRSVSNPTQSGVFKDVLDGISAESRGDDWPGDFVREHGIVD
jgi:hypothetical protein